MTRWGKRFGVRLSRDTEMQWFDSYSEAAAYEQGRLYGAPLRRARAGGHMIILTADRAAQADLTPPRAPTPPMELSPLTVVMLDDLAGEGR